jgi:hypothetical protein
MQIRGTLNAVMGIAATVLYTVAIACSAFLLCLFISLRR